MSKSMNIEYVEIMRISMMLYYLRDREVFFFNLSKGKKGLSRGNLDFEKFIYFVNTIFRHKSAL